MGANMRIITMYKKIWSLFIKYDRKKTVSFVAILLLISAISFLQPIFVGKIVFMLQTDGHFGVCLTLFLLCISTPAILRLLSAYNTELLTNVVQTDLQTDIFSSLIYEKNIMKTKSKGELVTSLHTDTSIIINVGKLMLSFSANVLSAMVASIGLLICSPLIFLISVCIAPLIFILNCSLNKNIGNYSQKKHDLSASYKNTINNIVFSYEEMKFQNSFEKAQRDVINLQNKITKNDIICDVRIDSPGRILDLIIGITPAIGYLLGVFIFKSDIAQLSLIVTCTSYMTNFWSKLSFVSFIKVLSEPLINSLTRVHELLQNHNNKMVSPIVQKNMSLDFERIVVNNLVYSHDTETPVFSGFSIVFPNNGLYILNGKSGSGKTTFLKLFLKEYETDKDHIFVDTTPLSGIETMFWRQNIGYMDQSSHLFSGTIKDNIELFNPHYDDEYIRGLADQLNIVSELGENFLDVAVFEDNVGLSGGQKDRIYLLCVLSKQPRILLLDEPTNGLDRSNIVRLSKVLQALKSNTLIICASHDAYLLEHCDNVVNI